MRWNLAHLGQPPPAAGRTDPLGSAARHVVGCALSAILLASPGAPSLAAFAAPPPLTAEQRLVAQAWKLTDREFVDRSFAGSDWFGTRQKLVRQPYGSREDAYAAVRDMLSGLGDKYTRFLTPAMYDSVYSAATGDVAGIGVELTTEGSDSAGRVSLASVVEGGPADGAGLAAGDVVLEVDGDELAPGLSAEEAAAKVRGAAGSKMRLVVGRAGKDGATESVAKVITRAAVKLEGVKSSMTSAGGLKVGYVRIKQFSTTTADDVQAALKSLSGAQAYVIDLRGNSGGYFPGGIDVARLLLPPQSPITYVVDKRSNVVPYESYATDGGYATTPLTVLVDAKTASASEILVGALRDNERASLLGPSKRTYGKAAIQNVEQLEDGSAVVVSIAKYETPSRADINGKGIEVDVLKECPDGAAAASCIPAELLKKAPRTGTPP